MNDEELDRLVAQSMYSDTDVRSLDLRVGEADLMENVMNSTTPTVERAQPVRPKPTRRRSKLFTGLVAGAAVAVGGGVAYAVVADRLSPEQAQIVDDVGATGESPCGKHQLRERPPRREHHQRRTHRRVLDGGRRQLPRGPSCSRTVPHSAAAGAVR